ncbi:MAG: coproporphyrinogen dehydrogenase HemZ [Ruminococcaceae bacterium]|nr:coproporphyrinogen dehydrogenase HemZ [Oscillospiraceae bacterium]
MKLFCISHNYHYEIENVIRLFLPFQKILVLKEKEELSGDYLYTEKQEENEKITLSSKFSFGGKEQENKKEYFNITSGEAELFLAGMVLEQFIEEFHFKPNWGIVTGVRPSKLMATIIDEVGEERAKERFIEKYLVKPRKADLAFNVAKMEEKIIKSADGNSFSLYISIPYCPTRCSYCSFVSHSISNEKAKDLIPQYVEKLCEELKATAEIAKKNKLYLKSVYWGGGTPTTLTHEQLDVILTEIENAFDLSECIEYTVEAGRPDTITKEKLEVLKKHNVNRISINPQTFNNSVLKEIGRQHSSEETIEKYNLAREIGFNAINMDLIAGLPTDTVEGFKNSIEKAISLNPENITVHTLSLKRSSTIVTEDERSELDATITSDMVEYAISRLTENGYKPYYMYRQSKSLGNLENVGWCKENKECYYNVYMMSECQTVLSVGAGSVTKLKEPDGKQIERIFNFKFPFEYIGRFNELIERKDRINTFFLEYPIKTT